MIVYGSENNFGGDLTNGLTTTVERILVNSDMRSSLKREKQRTMDLWDPSTEMHSVKAGMVGQ